MKKVYIGPSNLANFSENIEKSLNSVGVKAEFICWSNNVHPFNYGKQKTFKIVNRPPFKLFNKNIFFFFNEYFLKPFYFLCTLLKYDIYIFITPTTFLISNYDLKILKFFKKKVAFFNAGCVDRDLTFDSDPEYVCNLCTDIKMQKNCSCDNIDKKIARVNFFERHADYIFGPPDTVSYVKDKTKIRRLFNGFPEIQIKASQKKFDGRLRISHLPSNPLVKGTHIIEPVLKKLASEEDVDIVLKNGIWSRDRIINEFKNSHILIDSLAGYIFGTISLEAIQYGCVVLNAYPDWIANSYEIPPVVKVTGDTLYSTLKEMINNRDLMKQYAERSQEAYNKYFTYETAGNYYKKILKL